MSARTPLAAGIVCTEVSEPGISGWWVRPAAVPPDRALLYPGGGYRLGDASSYRGPASPIATRTGCAVFSIDYLLARAELSRAR